MSEEIQNLSLEELFQEVESILKKMEGQDIPLEDTFQLYEQGLFYLKECRNKIDTVEKKMMILTADQELVEE